MIHTDLKQDNILVFHEDSVWKDCFGHLFKGRPQPQKKEKQKGSSSRGGKINSRWLPTLKLIDFGGSVFKGEAEGGMACQQEQQGFLKVPEYGSPEQLIRSVQCEEFNDDEYEVNKLIDQV